MVELRRWQHCDKKEYDLFGSGEEARYHGCWAIEHQFEQLCIHPTRPGRSYYSMQGTTKTGQTSSLGDWSMTLSEYSFCAPSLHLWRWQRPTWRIFWKTTPTGVTMQCLTIDTRTFWGHPFWGHLLGGSSHLLRFVLIGDSLLLILPMGFIAIKPPFGSIWENFWIFFQASKKHIQARVMSKDLESILSQFQTYCTKENLWHNPCGSCVTTQDPAI